MAPPRHAVLGGLLLALCAQVTPRGLGDAAPGGYYAERKGMDTNVRRKSDNAIVYSTSVADTSEGSDTDQDISGDEEFFQGCLWTMRQQIGLCDGANCGDTELMAHDVQRRLLTFYENRNSTSWPPLEEVAYMTLGTRAEDRRELMQDCPGLIISVLFFQAELLTFTGSKLGEAYFREGQQYAAVVQKLQPRQFETMMEMFPVSLAYSGYEYARQRMELEQASVPTVDIVIAHCKTTLQWLWELDFPEKAKVRVFVFGKCAATDGEQLVREQVGLAGAVQSVTYTFVPEESDKIMSGECTAYLSHILRSLQGGDLADYTVFLHDDGPRHIRLSFLALAMRGLRNGAYRVPFLHLSHERYPSFRTPCLKDVYRRVMGEELQGRLTTYCCSHFIVSRERIAARSVAFYENIFRMVSHAEYDMAQGGACNVGKKPCYVMEFLWHRVFGEDDELPLRAEQPSLPLALRYEPGRFTQMPSPLKIAPYMIQFMPRRYSGMLEAST